jgi:hypothetical protein
MILHPKKVLENLMQVSVNMSTGTNAVAVSQRNKTELVDQEKQAWNEKKAKSRRTYVS